MLLRDLTIENYRSFEKYKLDGLARVNLLVGDNNCGKTSALEAGYILLQRGDQAAISVVLDERGDTALVEDRFRGRNPTLVARLPNLFRTTLNNSPLESRFNLGATDFGQLDVSMTTNADFVKYSQTPNGTSALVGMAAASAGDPHDRIVLSHFSGRGENVSARALTRDGFLELDRFQSIAVDSRNAASSTEEPPCCFVSAKGLAPKSLKTYWTSLIKSSAEGRVIEAVRIVLPELSGIVILPEIYSAPDSRADVLLNVGKERRSLACFGEGVSRLLALGIVLGVSQSGVLFIDEIETGLHYSKLWGMWRMLIKAAVQLDVQVFATSHSLDCLNGLSDCLQRDASLAEHVAVHRIERAIDEAVTLDGDAFVRAMDRDSEVR